MELLTVELLRQVCAARAARVLTVSSVAHFRGAYFDDLEHRKDFSGMAAYQDSKLYNVLFAQELAERLQCEAATSNVLHPGTISTKLSLRDSPPRRAPRSPTAPRRSSIWQPHPWWQASPAPTSRQAPSARIAQDPRPANAAPPVGSERRDGGRLNAGVRRRPGGTA